MRVQHLGEIEKVIGMSPGLRVKMSPKSHIQSLLCRHHSEISQQTTWGRICITPAQTL